MSITMREIDNMIDAAINRLAGENGSKVSNFFVDLRDYQKRITQNLITQCIDACHSRGLNAERHGDGLSITVHLDHCSLNPRQAVAFSTALNYTRAIHGNHI